MIIERFDLALNAISLAQNIQIPSQSKHSHNTAKTQQSAVAKAFAKGTFICVSEHVCVCVCACKETEMLTVTISYTFMLVICGLAPLVACWWVGGDAAASLSSKDARFYASPCGRKLLRVHASCGRKIGNMLYFLDLATEMRVVIFLYSCNMLHRV